MWSSLGDVGLSPDTTRGLGRAPRWGASPGPAGCRRSGRLLDPPPADPSYSGAIRARVPALKITNPVACSSPASLNHLGWLLLDQGDLDAAEPLLTRSVEIREKLLGADHDRTARSRYHLALLLWRKGDRPAAHRLMGRVVDSLNKRLGVDHRWTVEANRAMTDMEAAARV